MDDLELDEFFADAAKLEDGQEATQIAEAFGNNTECLNAMIAAVNQARFDEAEVNPVVKRIRDEGRLKSWHRLVAAVDIYIKSEN